MTDLKINDNLITAVIVSLVCAGLVTAFLALCVFISWGVVYVAIFAVMIPFMDAFIKRCVREEGARDVGDVLDIVVENIMEDMDENSDEDSGYSSIND